ncbi:hypothetical protein SRM_p61001 (plasmid) [Salinibacter ruber M8]|uniref:Uncharacterized protein n=1 Tax=Salinibacter ruber (strain M8) TaxID=761659 RepID=D5H4B7_SALRM|nr:hypothetical protein SRM_p61001 [Salinibacter ruber M8]
MAWSGRLQLGFQFVAHDPVNCRVRKLKFMLFGQPALDLLVTAKSFRLGETVFELAHHAGGNGLLTRIRAWFSNLAEPFEASVFVKLKPAGNRVAMDA